MASVTRRPRPLRESVTRGTPSEARWAVLRIALGSGQMTGAAVAAVLLLTQGVSSAAIAVVVLTSLITMTSVLLFRRRPPHVKP